MTTPLASLLGKYRDLVLAIGVFLLIDAGVSAINSYTSHQIEADAGRINDAGQLRTYSQQLTKALLTLDMDLRLGHLTQSSLAEISEARLGFDDTRQRLESRLQDAPRVPLADDAGKLHEEARNILQQVIHTWGPIDREVSLLLINADIDLNSASSAFSKALTRNNRLTQQASQLSDTLEAIARDKAAGLRRIQALAIGLALLNFAFIMFRFIGRLVASDRQTIEAREETERILGSVREGLFLLTRERRIGQQRSASLAELFGGQLPADADFHEFLATLVSPACAETAREYIDLLFTRKMKASLLEQLNPLLEVALAMPRPQRKGPTHLCFQFNPVREAGEVVALLVTVSDISRQVRLARELAGAEARAESEVRVLLDMLDHNPQDIARLLQRARDTLQMINSELQGVRPQGEHYPALVRRIARTIHGLKGESASLGCTGLARAAHAFEDVLQPLRQREDLGGHDLIPVAVGLNELLGEIAKADHVIARLRGFAAQRPGPVLSPLDSALQRLGALAEDLAGELGREISIERTTMPLSEMPAALDLLLREAAPQLIRNAIVHGLETPDERRQLGKPANGLIRMVVARDEPGKLRFSIEDDGRGLSAARLRPLIAERGLMSPARLAAASDEEILATLFEPGFSSLDGVHLHAGRGDGLAVVKDVVQRIGGRLRISTRPGRYTCFTVQIEAG